MYSMLCDGLKAWCTKIIQMYFQALFKVQYILEEHLLPAIDIIHAISISEKKPQKLSISIALTKSPVHFFLVEAPIFTTLNTIIFCVACEA